MKGWGALPDSVSSTTTHTDRYELMYSKSLAAVVKAEVGCRAEVGSGDLSLEAEDYFNIFCDNFDESMDIFMI